VQLLKNFPAFYGTSSHQAHENFKSRIVIYGRSVKLLLVFASTVIPVFSLFEIHDQEVYSPLLSQSVKSLLVATSTVILGFELYRDS
jgi:hypothetical protein